MLVLVLVLVPVLVVLVIAAAGVGGVVEVVAQNHEQSQARDYSTFLGLFGSR